MTSFVPSPGTPTPPDGGRVAAYAHLSDQTTWPMPDREIDDDVSLEWRLRYGTPTRGDLLHAASFVSAYGYLIDLPREKRQQIIRDLRRASR